MLRLLSLVALMLLSPSLLAAEQTRYISDNVYTFLHGGPGTQYRILGSVEAGQPVTYSGETQGDYVKIVDHKGREGWVDANLISSEKSFRVQLPEVQAKLDQVQAELSQVTADSNDSAQIIRQLRSQLATAEESLSIASNERDSATRELASIQNNERYEMLKQGGMIAGAGIILGVILVYLPRPRRRQKNRW
ncbi:TIGR04211 family SH3 domain-containing protein [Shewanella colwelliana]|uniref:TIGR04211 family SH3 domain-containing protein n=1 Tax=Shewanella colwelliana TaxID=23 RepID=UPI001BC7D2DF|nr:TIGR04211 family SH3 domain-containing protein [Shewanella colwelliana]MCZ4338969.1 TIGR04211 family SH3 domain-containing protein [Shewanella colwelliana]GIU24483.1 SH3 domain protein [Shewanella colwelliana]